MCNSIVLIQALEWHVPFITYWAVLWFGLVSTLVRSTGQFDQARFARIALRAAWQLAWSAPLKLLVIAFVGGSLTLAAVGWLCGTPTLEPRLQDPAWRTEFVDEATVLSMFAYLMVCVALFIAASRDLGWTGVLQAMLTYVALVFAPVLALAWSLSLLSRVTI